MGSVPISVIGVGIGIDKIVAALNPSAEKGMAGINAAVHHRHHYGLVQLVGNNIFGQNIRLNIVCSPGIIIIISPAFQVGHDIPKSGIGNPLDPLRQFFRPDIADGFLLRHFRKGNHPVHFRINHRRIAALHFQKAGRFLFTVQLDYIKPPGILKQTHRVKSGEVRRSPENDPGGSVGTGFNGLYASCLLFPGPPHFSIGFRAFLHRFKALDLEPLRFRLKIGCLRPSAEDQHRNRGQQSQQKQCASPVLHFSLPF